VQRVSTRCAAWRRSSGSLNTPLAALRVRVGRRWGGGRRVARSGGGGCGSQRAALLARAAAVAACAQLRAAGGGALRARVAPSAAPATRWVLLRRRG